MGFFKFIKKAVKSVRKIVTAPFKAVKKLIGGSSSKKSPNLPVTYKKRKAFEGRKFLNKLIPRSATSRGTRRPLNISRLSRVKKGVKKAKGLSKGKKGSPSFARNRQEKKEVYTRQSSLFKSRNKSTPVKSVSRKSRRLMKRGSRVFKRSEVSRNEGKLNRANRQSSRALRIQSRARGTDSVKK
jgi:hypothetical protein